MDSGIISWCWGTWNGPTWDKMSSSDTAFFSGSSSSSSMNSSSLLPTSSCVLVHVSWQREREKKKRICKWYTHTQTETFEDKRFYSHNPSHSAGPWWWRQTDLKKLRVSLRGVYVWNVNSTVTKYSDYFVWKDTSEGVTRRWDYTSWQEASEFLCIKTPPFFKGVQQQKNPPRNPRNALSDALLMSSFQNFAADAAEKKTALSRTKHNINSDPQSQESRSNATPHTAPSHPLTCLFPGQRPHWLLGPPWFWWLGSTQSAGTPSVMHRRTARRTSLGSQWRPAWTFSQKL